ncbi:SusD family protein [bacterium A37T11]|nr:SusD family protein [bacterium A37T11]
MNNYYVHPKLLLALLFLLSACGKDWLDAKRNLNTVVPVSLSDLEAVLNTSYGPSMASDYTGMMLASADDYISAETNLTNVRIRNIYTWQAIIYDGTNTTIQEWDNSYQQVLSANVVLETLEKINRTMANASQWDQVKGGALFFRSKAFFNLLQLFSKPYQSESAAQDAGVPLRLTSDPNIKSNRQSVAEGYTQVIADLKEAAVRLNLLPVQKILPGRQTAFALLARCFLSMRDYEQATLYADSALQIQSDLLDYNQLTTASDADFPIAYSNKEVILNSVLEPAYRPTIFVFCQTNPELKALYQEGDLRKNLFFTSDEKFRGNYTGTDTRFNGLAVDELYLIRAEGYARSGKLGPALSDLNYLLQNRYITETFVPLTAESTPDIIDRILLERRKELAFRGLRWSDLRRLNLEIGHEVTLQRSLAGETFKLPPNDARYTFPIPEYVIRDAGLSQNIR